MYLLHFEKIGLQLKKLVGLLNKLEESRSILLQDEQIPKHDDILFLISLGTNISSISLRLDWHLCSACLCFQVLYCTAPLAIKSSLEFVVGRTFQNKPRLNWGPLCCKFVFQFCFLFFLKLPVWTFFFWVKTVKLSATDQDCSSQANAVVHQTKRHVVCQSS